ncbi:MAG: ABC transporter substrate-binding protein [Gammaproteobacteria bacterium]
MFARCTSFISLHEAMHTLRRTSWLAFAFLIFVAGCAIPPYLNEDVLVVVSDTTPAYTRVADALRARLPGAPRAVQLNGDARGAEAIVRAQARDATTIVAVGALALQTARRVQIGGRVVFCQVFNYEEPGLMAPTVSGVKAMPPLVKQFRAWKLLDPKLQRIAVISGPGLRDLPDEAKRAAAELNLQVAHVVVHSDKELVYTARDRLKGVHGVWVAPDHRVLSAPALREFITHAVRHGTAVMVFNHQLLDEGAVMSAESDYTEVAERVVDLVLDPESQARLVALKRARVRINDLAAARLGLAAPPQFARGTYVF